MKVIRVITELNYGGIEKVFELHAKHHDHSSELVFIALSKGGNTQQLLQAMGYKVIVLNVERVIIPSFPLIQTLMKIFKQEKPDIIHTAGAEANFHATIAAKLAGVGKVVCEEIGIPEHSFKARLLFRFVYLFSERVIAISKAVEKFLISSQEVPVDKVQLIYNPVNEVIEADCINKDKFLFTIVARLEPIKNIALLIDTFHEFQKNEPEAKLNILGEGSLKEQLQQQVKELRIENKILFKGFVSDPTPLLTQSTYFVLPSLFEGFGLACIEAIQAGNIAICTNSGGIPEFIEHGKDGFLFDPNSKEALLGAMKKAVTLSEGEKLNMIEAANERVTQMFSSKKYVSQLNELYNSVHQRN